MIYLKSKKCFTHSSKNFQKTKSIITSIEYDENLATRYSVLTTNQLKLL